MIFVLSLVLAQVHSKGNPYCWTGNYTYEICCGETHDPACFDQVYNKESCCNDKPKRWAPKDCWTGKYTWELCCRGTLPFGTKECFGTDRLGGLRCCLDTDDACGRGPPYPAYRISAWQYVVTGVASDTFVETSAYLSRFNINDFDDSSIKCKEGLATAHLVNILLTAGFGMETNRLWMYSAFLMKHGNSFNSSSEQVWPLEELYKKAWMEAQPPLHEDVNHSVEIVIGYCQEDMRWIPKGLRPDILASIDVTVVLKCGHPENPMTIDQFKGARKLRFIEVFDEMKADECSAYFGFLEERYDTFADYTLMIHPDITEHIPDVSFISAPHLNSLEMVIRSAQLGRLHAGVINLGHHQIQERARNTPTRSPFEYDILWRKIFQSSTSPAYFDAYCCSQFIVSRERLLLRPRSFYAHARKVVSGKDLGASLLPGTNHINIRTLLPSSLMESMWHVMWGEELSVPEKDSDPNLNYFLKTVNRKVNRRDKSSGIFSIDPW